MTEHAGPLLVPSMCIAEVSHITSSRGAWQAEVRLLAAFAAGDLTISDFHPGDVERTAELVSTYRDLPLGSVDASIVAAAERLDLTQIATLDRRHFSVVRPRHVDVFELLP